MPELIDPRAAIDPAAELDEGVSVGPFAVIGAGVQIGAGTRIGPHAVIKGPTSIGRDNRIFQFTSVGEDPQDKKYAGEPTRLEIGDRNSIREFVSIHRGTVQDEGVTRIGSDNLLMASVHVAHDCQIGNNVILANGASLAGHVKIGDWAILGGFSMVHQFSRIGAHSFSGMGSAISKDVPPYLLIGGNPTKPHGINTKGLRRRGFSSDSMAALKRAYRKLYLSGETLADASREIRAMSADFEVLAPLADFLEQEGRSIIR
jgi:UDP-N-acetylglucosamine acyltransferase